MSLSTAMNIGRSALSASQVGLSVAGQNMANATTAGYTRQVATFYPIAGDSTTRTGAIGRGVGVMSVRRQLDSALQARLWTGVSDEAGAQQALAINGAIEATIGELSDYDLSSELTAFFSSWSERANQTKSSAVVVQGGQRLAAFVTRLRQDLANTRDQVDSELGASIRAADEMLSVVARMNQEIADSEIAGFQAAGLRDQRDQAITELSKLLDVSVVEQGNGMVDVLVGSTPIVQGSVSRGLELEKSSVDGTVRVDVAVKADQEHLPVRSGKIGGLLESRDSTADKVIGELDDLAAQIIFQVNKLHSTGANVTNPASAEGTLKVALGDRTRALNDPANQSLSDLPFAAVNGGFLVNVKQTGTGTMKTVRIDVDLDGRKADGTPGFDDDTTPEDIRAALDAVPGLSASFTSDGRLKVDADSGFEVSFADDSSGALAVLGVNSFFEGTSARDIAVRGDLASDPSKLMSGRYVNGSLVENGTALSIVNLQDRAISDLDGRTLRGAWTDSVQAVGVAAKSSESRAVSTGIIRQSLESQRAAVSGVSLDEESVNLLDFQRQYQGAARLISIADELTQTLLGLL
ncbi:MAG: flagellar hook-associated protein FlgK [Phycisphaerae bacterium]|nr:flagellar hook-associated protein FlgK [Phycisphaerae bacterium]